MVMRERALYTHRRMSGRHQHPVKRHLPSLQVSNAGSGSTRCRPRPLAAPWSAGGCAGPSSALPACPQPAAPQTRPHPRTPATVRLAAQLVRPAPVSEVLEHSWALCARQTSEFEFASGSLRCPSSSCSAAPLQQVRPRLAACQAPLPTSLPVHQPAGSLPPTQPLPPTIRVK